MCIPGSNAIVEHIFSNMNSFWSDERSRMDVETIGVILTVKHFTRNCLEFHGLLIQNTTLIKHIHYLKNTC